MRKIHLVILAVMLSLSGYLTACSDSQPSATSSVAAESAMNTTAKDDADNGGLDNDSDSMLEQGQDTSTQVPTPLAPNQLQDDEDVFAIDAEDDITYATALEPVSLNEAIRPLVLQLLSKKGYQDAEGQLVLDIMEQDSLDLLLVVLDANGRPVQFAKPAMDMDGDSKVLSKDGLPLVTDASGGTRFSIVGGSMGEQTLTVTVNKARTQALLNVISIAASGYGNLSDIEGVLPWDTLMEARINWGEQMSVSFPEAVEEQNGKMVKVAGFMMPLDMSEEQSHFVLTSNPPSCFFHIPGGPAGAMEVFADKPITTVWTPVILEGRFEAVSVSETGVPYRLHDAKLLDWPEE